MNGLDDRHVGAGLLAKALCQSTLMLADIPSSRASPLPHLICVWLTRIRRRNHRRWSGWHR
ncbi:hypothetical protein E3W21_21830 [Pseudomonas sp. F01002]|nr:hypothetical protein FQ187_24015 [Pseudomonas sp. ANT_J28]TFB37363.1 hypothetical protein E3W21_21830 [Pseudomonas sp. F01002]